MTHTPLLWIHILAGAIALIAGCVALFAKKGAQRHRLAGNYFVGSMILMAGLGAVNAYLAVATISVLAGCLTTYMVVSSWLVVTRRPGQTGQGEWALAMVPLAVAVSALTHGLEAAASPSGYIEDVEIGAPAYFFFAVMASLAFIGDIVYLLRDGLYGSQRIARHLWRMGFALWIATTSLFEGQAHLFPDSLRETGVLSYPGHIVFIVTIFWLLRPLFINLSRIFFNRPRKTVDSNNLLV